MGKDARNIHLVINPPAAGLTHVQFGQGATPVGAATVVWSDAGVLALWFGAHDSAQVCAGVVDRFDIDGCGVQSDELAQSWLDRIFVKPSEQGDDSIAVVVRGSDFDVEVWQALCQIPYASLQSYGDLARFLGRAGAARAVGGALGRNGVAYLVPCHRVVRQTGQIGEFRWGRPVKQALIDWEAAT